MLEASHSVDPFTVSSSLELSSSGLSVATACLIMCPCLHSLLLEQVEDITAVHETAMVQLENNHLVSITILQDENDCKIQGKPKTTQWLQSYSRAGISAVVRLCKPGFSSP